VTHEDLEQLLKKLEGRGYKAYKDLGESYAFPDFLLRIDHVQGDPFAEPSRMRVIVPQGVADLPPASLSTPAGRMATADFLNRTFAEALRQQSTDRGSGRSGELTILQPSQIVLPRTSLIVHPDGAAEARFRAGLPARGRTILGDEAAMLLCQKLPQAVRVGLFGSTRDASALMAHIHAVEDAQALRAQLATRGLISFVADGACLPRRSGVDDRPLEGDRVTPFESPAGLRVTLDTPHSGALEGMGIPQGVTLLVGGGFHGKSTLLRAVERGVYDHVPGDGRERVVTRRDAVKARAEDGRAVAGTDISNFIADLPGGEDTSRFVTANASGSTSQAASLVEALEVGAHCLLLDEDTSATNFLIRDARVQTLIRREAEPITPLIDRVRDLAARGISLVLVVGGSGDYFDVADTVIAMEAYRPDDVTDRAREIARGMPSLRRAEARDWAEISERVPLPDTIDPSRGHRRVEIRAYAAERVTFGTEPLDLSAVEQLVETAQTRAIARTLAWARGTYIDGKTPLAAALEGIMQELESGGLDLIDDRLVGDYAGFRVWELAAALNRLRTLRVRGGS
jgi:predicted ABC-class ATPase